MYNQRSDVTCRRCGSGRLHRGRVLAKCLSCGYLLPLSAASGDDDTLRTRSARSDVERLLRGKYRVERRLGGGAHGATYLARHVHLGLPVAVKFLPEGVRAPGPRATRHLRDEARTGFYVHDPHVVRVLECDVAAGTWYFVAEYVEGADLSAFCNLDDLPRAAQARELLIDAARGLRAIHAARLVHRDIKPSNLLVDLHGRLRIADLGVATLVAAQHERREIPLHDVAGTLAYTAPETFTAGSRPDVRSDLYSLGATFFHLLTGHPPHAAARVFEYLVDVQCKSVTWPSHAADVPDRLKDVVLRMLAGDPDDRFPDCDGLLRALDAPVQGDGHAPAPAHGRELRPRGVAVLPFDNRGRPGDDWLGHGVARALGQMLAETGQVYVADAEALALALPPNSGNAVAPPGQQLLDAGRLFGAGTIVTGSYEMEGDAVTVYVRTLRAAGEAQDLPRAQGDLRRLDRLLAAILEQLEPRLGVRTDERPVEYLPALGALEAFERGRQAYRRGEYDEAIRLGEAAAAEDPEFAEAVGFVGVCLARLGRYDQAEEHHWRQESMAQARGDLRPQIEAQANLGVMNYFRGAYERAEAHYARALALAQTRDLPMEVAQINNNLGFVLFRLGRAADAEGAFRRAIQTHERFGVLRSLVGPYNGLGNLLADEGRSEEARAYYRQALALATEIGDRTSVGTTHMHLGRLATRERRYDQAKQEFTMALNALEETRFWNGLARAYEYIAELHMELGDAEQAVRCAKQRVELARRHGNARLEAAAREQVARALKLAGRFEEAAAVVGRACQAAAARSGPTVP